MVESITSTLEFQMSLLLFVSLIGYLISSKINQSAVTGEIFLGLIMGPSFLGLLTYTEFISSLAHLGAVILLFVIGLEFKLRDIFDWKYIVIALMGVIVPWIGGFYISRVFGYGINSAIFVGTALTATSIAITANVFKETGKLQTNVAKTIIGAAIVDDVLSILALSVSEQLVSNAFSLYSLSSLLFKAILFLVVGIFVGEKYLSHLLEYIDRAKVTKRFQEFPFVFAMAIAFLYALVAELMGLSPIIGSFIAGVALERAILIHGRDYKEGAEYLHIIFASIFFVSIGVLVDISVVNLNFLIFLIALTFVAILTKVIGCYIPSKLQGLSHTESFAVGFGMSPRAEVATIAALLGLNAGIINQDLYTSIILMCFFTTIISPIVLQKWLNNRLTNPNKM